MDPLLPNWLTADNVFGRSIASSLVTGFSANCHYRRKTADQAWIEWKESNLAHRALNPLHPLSLFPKVVSRDKLQARADAANMAAYLTDNEEAAATTTPADPALAPVPTAVPTATATATANTAAVSIPALAPAAALFAPPADSAGRLPVTGARRGWVVIRGKCPAVYDN